MNLKVIDCIDSNGSSCYIVSSGFLNCIHMRSINVSAREVQFNQPMDWCATIMNFIIWLCFSAVETGTHISSQTPLSKSSYSHFDWSFDDCIRITRAVTWRSNVRLRHRSKPLSTHCGNEILLPSASYENKIRVQTGKCEKDTPGPKTNVLFGNSDTIVLTFENSTESLWVLKVCLFERCRRSLPTYASDLMAAS